LHGCKRWKGLLLRVQPSGGDSSSWKIRRQGRYSVGHCSPGLQLRQLSLRP
jgi:hypothetical protein